MREAMGGRISQMIKKIPFFAQVKKLDLLSSLFHLREYDSGTTIFKQGDPSDAFYMILKGQCHVYAERSQKSTTENMSMVSSAAHVASTKFEMEANSADKDEGAPGSTSTFYTTRGSEIDGFFDRSGIKLLRVLESHDFFGEIEC